MNKTAFSIATFFLTMVATAAPTAGQGFHLVAGLAWPWT